MQKEQRKTTCCWCGQKKALSTADFLFSFWIHARKHKLSAYSQAEFACFRFWRTAWNVSPGTEPYPVDILVWQHCWSCRMRSRPVPPPHENFKVPRRRWENVTQQVKCLSWLTGNNTFFQTLKGFTMIITSQSVQIIKKEFLSRDMPKTEILFCFFCTLWLIINFNCDFDKFLAEF